MKEIWCIIPSDNSDELDLETDPPVTSYRVYKDFTYQVETEDLDNELRVGGKLFFKLRFNNGIVEWRENKRFNWSNFGTLTEKEFMSYVAAYQFDKDLEGILK